MGLLFLCLYCLTSERSVLSTCPDTVSAAILRTTYLIGKDVLPPVEADFLGHFEY